MDANEREDLAAALLDAREKRQRLISKGMLVDVGVARGQLRSVDGLLRRLETAMHTQLERELDEEAQDDA